MTPASGCSGCVLEHQQPRRLLAAARHAEQQPHVQRRDARLVEHVHLEAGLLRQRRAALGEETRRQPVAGLVGHRRARCSSTRPSSGRGRRARRSRRPRRRPAVRPRPATTCPARDLNDAPSKFASVTPSASTSTARAGRRGPCRAAYTSASRVDAALPGCQAGGGGDAAQPLGGAVLRAVRHRPAAPAASSTGSRAMRSETPRTACRGTPCGRGRPTTSPPVAASRSGSSAKVSSSNTGTTSTSASRSPVARWLTVTRGVL